MVLANNNLHGPIPETLGLAHALVRLHLSNNTMTGTVPTTLGLLLNLHFLQLDGNNFRGQVPPEVCSLNLAFEMKDAVSADCRGPDPKLECKCCTSCQWDPSRNAGFALKMTD